MYRLIEYGILYVVMVILQVFLFSRIGISVYVHPLAYIAFIILLPMSTPGAVLFVVGGSFGNDHRPLYGYGWNQYYCYTFRRFLSSIGFDPFIGKDEVKEGGVPNVNRVGLSRFLRYATVMVLLHSTLFFYFGVIDVALLLFDAVADHLQFGGHVDSGLFLSEVFLS